ncbi:L-ribulose-5-phosphate 4-epimerase AraD [Consotaella salsifontis]|uniref:L-ribulose-5-phosphate 4-epimerase n=1 Tax=Consotaella salsifontis TaxID=1365950 RepID=A0A1T4T445_9HYPH|nr:L-ribulose-5-phosphate 4-epimerase AraD [Consotaella salsifontis]SKA35069.1 L-ribulose 5-phosphate 4-epimerase [Consotaella salsifontis]
MLLEELRAEVCEANLELQRKGIVILTWGNVSAIDRASGLVVIKPSGVAYDDLTPDKMVVVDLDNKVVEGTLNPSTDTATHTVLYKAFGSIGGVAHTHSMNAVAWAQARRPIPCFGTTHADHCFGAVPCTPPLSEDQVTSAYEAETGHQIVREMGNGDPLARPMMLVAGHGPFTWGKSAKDAVVNAVVLEEVARMASATLALDPRAPALEDYVLSYHYQRKHGPGAWYGQKA